MKVYEWKDFIFCGTAVLVGILIGLLTSELSKREKILTTLIGVSILIWTLAILWFCGGKYV